MKTTHRIDVKGISLYAYHGCMSEEARIGATYNVDVSVWADLTRSAQTDELNDTVDYVALNRIVTEEMAIRAKLLEVVAQRIVNRIFADHPEITRADVEVSKLSPPINGDVARVTVAFSSTKS